MERNGRSSPWVASAKLTRGYGGNLTVVDTVLPEMVHLVASHWYQFPPLDEVWHIFIASAIGVLVFMAVMGNGTVIYIFSTTKSLRTPSNLLVCNLAFSDVSLMCTMGVPTMINCYYRTWVFGPFFCQIYGCLGSLFGSASIWTMAVIALDRYNVIVRGLTARPLTIKSALGWCAVVWIISIVWTIAPVFGWGRYAPEGNMVVCGTDYLNRGWLNFSYVLAYTIFVYFVPLFLILYAYWFIVKAVSAHEKAMRQQAKKMNVASLRSSNAKEINTQIKLAKVAMVTISLWFIAWTPYTIINFIGIFGMGTITPFSTFWCSLFAKASSVYNPIVYAISHPKYKQVLHAKFPSLKCGSDGNDTTSTASRATVAEDDKA
uniref:Long wavelength sensitive opsin 1 n=1 Tax=Eulasia bombylius TaxID=1661826 RepID=A0A8F2P3T1_9SCAR|nr:long wavelength sensitive opsin 1 [Eulasia bombylius]